MILQLMWFIMVVLSAAYACLGGNVQQILPSLLKGCENAIVLTMKLGAGYMLFCGLMAIAEEEGLHRAMERLLHPLLRLLMPSVKEAKTREAAAMNLSMNMLGMGNAATPMGMEAVRQMELEERNEPRVRHDLYMLLVVNATSIQLLPTTILALRTAAGSADVNAVVVPTLVCTVLSTVVGAGLGMMCRKWGRAGR